MLVGRNGKVAVHAGRQIPPSLRGGIGVWTSMQRRARIRPLDICYICGELFEFDELALDHVVPVAEDLLLALDPANLQPCCRACHRKKTNSEQKLARRGQTAGVGWTRVTSIADAGEEMTYDLELEGPNRGFVADGLVVHNSYNEESGRYRELNPVFYVPARERLLVQEGKPGHYDFVDGSDTQHAQVVDEIRHAAATAYQSYQRMLHAGVAREVARAVLPVTTYSSMYATCNARSLMAFLSLRTKREDSTFPSYPQREIEMVAEKMETIWAGLMPITYDAFNQAGRVSP
jgi:thymidylate synthase (FAD)